MGYPSALEEERSVLGLHACRPAEPLEELKPGAKPGWVVEAQRRSAECVKVDDEVLGYVAVLVRLTRPEVNRATAEYFELGASPGAGITLLRMAKAWAFLDGRDYVTRRDADGMLFAVLNHRVTPRLDQVVEYEERRGRYAARYMLIADGLEAARGAV